MKLTEIIQHIEAMSTTSEKVRAINEVKLALHKISPMQHEPVDCVLWVESESVLANDYNPNAVAPPEMELLHTSIAMDGFTQPIVAWESAAGQYTVVDGFHRNRVGKEYSDVRDRICGFLPVTIINGARTELGDRMVSTIRHNRARGKHNVDSMSDIVVELKKRNWTDGKISKALGMQADEILRLCQISGLTEMFKDHDFSKAWDLNLDDDDTSAMESMLSDADISREDIDVD